MSEYWKSTPKKFCDFCKCWIADNKPSIDFHEKGKNHQANVKRRLGDIKKNTAKKRQQEEEFKNDLAAIEAAALKAVQKDFKANPDAVGQTDVRAVVKASNASIQNATSQASAEKPVWVACQAPSGHTYYYNNITGESKWEIPQELAATQGLNKNERDLSDIDSKPHGDNTDMVASKTEEARDCHPLLGGWTTVTTHQRDHASFVEEHASKVTMKQETPDQTKDNSTASAESTKMTAANPRSLGIKFKEKTVKVGLTEDNAVPVAFKKRKTGNIRSLRKKDDDD